MDDIVVELVSGYGGPVSSILIDVQKGVTANFHPFSGIPISFTFSGKGKWTDDQARKYIENRKLSNSRYKSSGESSERRIRLNSNDCGIELVTSDDKVSEAIKVLGQKTYDRLVEIEQKYGSDKPFLTKMTAMDFKGKDNVIGDSANGLYRFDKKGTIENIDSFQGIPMYLGHAGFFESYQKRVANTVKSFVDEKGNPAVYSYIYPHGEAGSLREDLRIAEAQGQLNTFELSCTGDPIDYEVIDDRDHKDFGKVDVDVKTWRAESLDFVNKGAVSGSQTDSILNAKKQDVPIIQSTPTNGGNKLEITLSDAFNKLKEKKIVLSEVVEQMSNIKAEIDKQIIVALAKQKDELFADEEFAKEIIEKADSKILLASDNVKTIIEKKFEDRLTNYDEAVESIDKFAKDNKIELSVPQLQFVKNNLRGEETDQQKIEIIQAASKFVNLKGVDGFFEEEKVETGPRISMGASVTEIKSSDVKVEI